MNQNPIARERGTSRIFSNLVILFILLIPLNNLSEVTAMMRGQLEWGAWAKATTDIYIKLIKDLFLISALTLGLVKIKNRKEILLIFAKNRLFIFLNVFIALLLLASAISITTTPLELVAIGFRAYWTLFLVYVGAIFYDADHNRISKYFFIIFIIHFSLQIAQAITGVGYAVFHEHRNPGIFIVPSTAGAFSLLAYYFANERKSTPLKIISVTSTFLSSSTIGILSLAFYFLTAIYKRTKQKLIFFIFSAPVAALSAYFVFDNLGSISGRGDAAYLSLFTRFGYISDVLEDISNLALGKGMGIATSQAVISGVDGAIVADNTFTGGMLNIGWIATVFVFCFMICSRSNFKNQILFLLFLGYSMVSNIFEMSPVIQILMILLGSHTVLKWKERARTTQSASIKNYRAQAFL